MSMCYSLYPASDDTIRTLIDTPTLIHGFLGNEPTSAAKRGFFPRLFGSQSSHDETGTAEAVHPISDIEPCDLDKAWHGLHFLFTGSDWDGAPPNSFLLNWGTEIGEIDIGYGPGRGLKSNEIHDVQQFLSRQEIASLRNNFDPDKMMELGIYPNHWTRDPEEELDYLLDFLPPLKEFICELDSRQLGAVVQLA